MSKKFNWKVAITAILFVLLVSNGLVNSAIAANTHSINLARSNEQYLSIPDGSQSGLDITGDLTIGAWLKLGSQPTPGQLYTIAGKYNNGTSDTSYLFQYENSGGTYRLGVFLRDGAIEVGRSVNVTLATSAWTHVAFVYSAAGGSGEFFVNGVSKGVVNGFSTTITNSSANFSIGAWNLSSPLDLFDGLIDDLRVWSRELTGTEISNLYTDPENFNNGSNLVAWWKFDGDFADASGGGNTLIPTNNPEFNGDTPFGDPPPPPFEETLEIRKSADQSVSVSTTPQEDSELALSLSANKTYIIDGVIFVSSTKAIPDIKLQFNGQPGSMVSLGYMTTDDMGVLNSGVASQRIAVPANTPIPVYVRGTVKTGDVHGNLDFLWAQATSNATPTIVLEGSYLRAVEI